ncbi:J domain-containing protein [Halogeometricum borinquense]|uniref:DnaJ-like protein n=2 Tax=Halogeometricum borinquense TaxID=60847 RepID=E4NMH2_HALBP|nr:J domain-containing protein [Halogeometricum borinquense]ADQ68470.1 DnaJ-like protein [Halogeometricum borinquense DSM 11551]ELY27886.1 dnaj-like protein [Halogeometricum borinquense DSM 11551]QIQ77626.1 J domain-containing protein [Halogeometricum borinquense]RYJ14998.1 J domain-containing protein [Halogeometricum borinquense]
MSDGTAQGELDWPPEFERTPADERRSYPHGFEVTRSEAFDSVLKQLRRMDAKNVRLDTDAEHQKRNPNKPYANSSFDDPGVVVRFEHDGEQYAMPMDKWDNPRDNARAIALTLKAKRALTRYGVETIESEFSAHQLPPGDDRENVVVSGAIEEPHEILGVASDAPESVVKAAARTRKKETHPDNGGDVSEFKRVVNAEEELL